MEHEKLTPQALAEHCAGCGAIAPRRDGTALRCACGTLLARYVTGGIELKCRRCKRTVFVPVEPAREETSTR